MGCYVSVALCQSTPLCAQDVSPLAHLRFSFYSLSTSLMLRAEVLYFVISAEGLRTTNLVHSWSMKTEEPHRRQRHALQS